MRLFFIFMFVVGSFMALVGCLAAHDFRAIRNFVLVRWINAWIVVWALVSFGSFLAAQRW